MSQEIVFDRYDDIREAMYDAALSRGFDTRSFEEGNPRAGILSILHGDEHKRRRRIENPLFGRDVLIEYEQELFPRVLDDVCARQAVGEVDLFRLAGQLSVVLAAKRAGIDHDGSEEQLQELFEYVQSIAQASAILDVVVDRDRVREEVRRTLIEFDEKYVTPSRQNRQALLDALEPGDGALETVEGPPYDLLTVVLQRVRDGEPPFDHGVLVREAGLFLHGGSHTSAQTVCNAFYYLLGHDGGGRREEMLEGIARDRLTAQRCAHETLRLRPTTPEIKRLALADTEVGGVTVPEGSTVVLNVRAANRDPELFGDRPEEFDPFRQTDEKVPLWGLSFGAGPHICIGRSVAGGFPLQAAAQRDGVGPGHLYGLVALMLQALAAREPELVAGRLPEPDDRTDRGTRWLRFPVEFTSVTSPLAGSV